MYIVAITWDVPGDYENYLCWTIGDNVGAFTEYNKLTLICPFEQIPFSVLHLLVFCYIGDFFSSKRLVVIIFCVSVMELLIFCVSVMELFRLVKTVISLSRCFDNVDTWNQTPCRSDCLSDDAHCHSSVGSTRRLCAMMMMLFFRIVTAKLPWILSISCWTGSSSPMQEAHS